MSTKKRRPDQSYIKSAQEYGVFAPGLARFAKRKKLKPWEKAYIARIENLIHRETRGKSSLIPLSDSDAKRLKDKSLIVGHGIRATVARNMSEKATARVDEKGQLHFKENGRTLHVISVSPFPEDFIETGLAILSKHPRQLWFNFVNGRGNAAYLSDEIGKANYVKDVMTIFEGDSPKGKPLNKAAEDILLGLIWMNIPKKATGNRNAKARKPSRRKSQKARNRRR